MSNRAPSRSFEEQYELVMQCRTSGLSDYQWCLAHDINPGTFYNWVRRLRKRACNIPNAAGCNSYAPGTAPDVVKLEIIPEADVKNPEYTVPYRPVSDMQSSIEIKTETTQIRIGNNADPVLLKTVLDWIGGGVC